MSNRIAAGVVAGLLALGASPALAQDKKPAQPDAVRALELELAKLRAAEADLQAKLQHLRAEAARKGVIERVELNQIELKVDDAKKLAQAELDRALKAGDAQLKRAQVEFEKALNLKAGQDKPKVLVPGPGGKPQVAYEQMTPEQLKELITKLQRVLDEKTRGPDKAKPDTGDKPKPGATNKVKPAGGKVKPGAASQDEVLKRLDKLTAEVEDLKRAIKK